MQKKCDIIYNIILVQGFCPLKTKIIQISDGLCLNSVRC